MNLDDTHIKVFGVFMNWLYTQQIVDSKGRSLGCGSLMNLWLLADRILIPTLQNQVVVELDRARKAGGSLVAECGRVFANTHPDSPLRRYIIDTWNFTENLGDDSSYPQELLVGIVNTVISRKDPTGIVILTEQECSKYFIDEKVGLTQSRSRMEATSSG